MILYINFECTWTPTYVVLPTPMSWSKHGTDYWAAFRVINQLWQSCTSLGKDWERKAHNLAKWTVPFQAVLCHISGLVRGESLSVYFLVVHCVRRGHRKLDGQQASPKITKHHFFQDNQVSFSWVTGIGLKGTQFFSFQKISTNTVARGVPSFGRNGPWLAGRLSNGHNFCKKSTQTCACLVVKISER